MEFEKLQRIIADVLNVDPEDITMSTTFVDDLGADSVDLVELIMAMEEEFDVGEVGEEELAGLKTVGDCVNYLAGKLK